MNDLVTLVTAMGSLIATGAVLYSLIVLRNQLRLQVFLEYTRRFDDIQFAPEHFNIIWTEMSPEQSTAAQVAFRKYFDLCSQEWWLNQTGKIESGVWKVWSRGIEETINSRGGSFAWGQMRSSYGAVFPGFSSYVDSLKRA